MAGYDDQRPSPAGIPVPDLIERYRSRRDAWIAQADELARLRDEVRGSAEREAMEIVTAARRDVRRIVAEARRELLVLSAQVQAALGEATAKADPATLLQKAGFTSGDETNRLSSTLSGAASESGVDDILKDLQADVTALAEDARALPMQATSPSRLGNGSAQPAIQNARLVASVQPAPATPPFQAAADEERPPSAAALSEAASRALLSSPYPVDAVPVPRVRRLTAFAGMSVAAGMLILLGTFWWLRDSDARDEPPESIAEASATRPNSRPAVPAPAAAPSALSEPSLPVRKIAAGRSGNVSVVAESIRDVWLRTTIDGREDLGRTLSAGEVVNLSADQSISLRVGDAGALVVSVNGGEKRPLGRDGQVMTRQFVVEDVRSAAVRTPSGLVAPPRAAAAERTAASKLSDPSPVLPPVPEPDAPARGTFVPQPVATGSVSPANPPSAAAAATPPSRPAPPAATSVSTSAADLVLSAARQWLDAYYRKDQAAMAALSTDNVTLADERQPIERLPSGLADVKRTLDRHSVQIAADTAVLTAVMTEQSAVMPTPRVSPVSQVWVLSGGQWKVRQVRFVSESRLNQVFR
jgi:hypothetical protein